MIEPIRDELCPVAPSPELAERLRRELDYARSEIDGILASNIGPVRHPRTPGFDDGMIIPADRFPAGTAEAVVRRTAAERAPLRGQVRVIVVLVDFADLAMTATADHFRDLFFSEGLLPHGSVKEYYREVTNGLVDIVGEVIGVYRAPQTLAWYANGNYGIGRPPPGTTRARDLARDAAVLADPHIDLGPYDNDGNGYVDAFIVVHAGPGGEETGDPNHIWSHKWVLPAEYTADTTRIFGYLTVPEDARLGVCAHELGHLLFGFPDLYDTDGTSMGVGDWCLMGGGSWNGGGDIPAHPSAWCKAQQGWVSTVNVTAAGQLTLPDVKNDHTIWRLSQDGGPGPEYFLVENRQRAGYDAALPGEGLLVWHIDENQPGNTDENHYKVGLEQADGRRDLELGVNQGDDGDPFPGSSGNTAFTPGSTPDSDSYLGQDTCVALTGISPPGPVMTASAAVRCGKNLLKDIVQKEHKEPLKEWWKERKEFKEIWKERKDRKDVSEWAVGASSGGAPAGDPRSAEFDPAFLEARIAALEEIVAGRAQPFITADLRPDLVGGPVYGAEDLQGRMEEGDPQAKRGYDTAPPR